MGRGSGGEDMEEGRRLEEGVGGEREEEGEERMKDE